MNTSELAVLVNNPAILYLEPGRKGLLTLESGPGSPSTSQFRLQSRDVIGFAMIKNLKCLGGNGCHEFKPGKIFVSASHIVYTFCCSGCLAAVSPVRSASLRTP